MIVAVGHDLIEIERVRGTYAREGERFLRLFAQGEIDYCLRLADPVPSFAVRFAAKEAFQKVWPRPFGWRDVWVVRERTQGGPFPFAPPLLGYAPQIEEELRRNNWTAHVTLTHTKEHASAVVVLEQSERELSVTAPAAE